MWLLVLRFEYSRGHAASLWLAVAGCSRAFTKTHSVSTFFLQNWDWTKNCFLRAMNFFHHGDPQISASTDEAAYIHTYTYRQKSFAMYIHMYDARTFLLAASGQAVMLVAAATTTLALLLAVAVGELFRQSFFLFISRHWWLHYYLYTAWLLWYSSDCSSSFDSWCTYVCTSIIIIFSIASFKLTMIISLDYYLTFGSKSATLHCGSSKKSDYAKYLFSIHFSSQSVWNKCFIGKYQFVCHWNAQFICCVFSCSMYMYLCMYVCILFALVILL